MAHGGKRAGAGRKPGSATKKTREIADRAAAEGITPLEVMLETMRDYWNANKKAAAALVARDAAPYMHPKLSATTVSGSDDDPPIRQRIEQVIVDPKG